jgi:hypothetical protein
MGMRPSRSSGARLIGKYAKKKLLRQYSPLSFHHVYPTAMAATTLSEEVNVAQLAVIYLP